MSAFHSHNRHSDGFILQLFLVIILGASLCVWAVRTYVTPPADFPIESSISVEAGQDLGTVAYNLEKARIVKSADAFKLLMLAMGSENSISVGTYYFPVPVSSIEVAMKMSGNAFGVLQNKVTFPEGYTNGEMAARLKANFPEFDAAAFLTLSKDKQGYLFPDTYSFDPDVSADVVVNTLMKTFEEKTATFADDFAASKRSKKDIIIMASILEKEAANSEEMPVVAGILWKRINLGIALQVDAPLALMLGKTSAELTAKDLQNPSPYNTYVHRGLVPAPITNPGLDAIAAALRPVESPYLYYLHDSKGAIHYASTFEGHKQNKALYLD
jgi:UPF0755 protein